MTPLNPALSAAPFSVPARPGSERKIAHAHAHSITGRSGQEGEELAMRGRLPANET
jgi:hypothetical protein